MDPPAPEQVRFEAVVGPVVLVVVVVLVLVVVLWPGQVFVKTGDIYAVYLPLAQKTGTLDLSGVEGVFERRWFNPRTGEYTGETVMVTGGSAVELGPAPEPDGEDWVVLLKRK